ncbi:hypothetical protein C8F01DRAFT_441261 [Mycena amicta]|nr:hypothetical protein C8F01DRAFT_441261 [Mycena amicta]
MLGPGDRESPEYDRLRSSTGHLSLKKRATKLSPNKLSPCPQKTALAESDSSVRSAHSLKSPRLSRNSLPRSRPLLESPAKARKVSVAASDADDESDTPQTIQPLSFDSDQGDSDRDDHGPEATPRRRRTRTSVPTTPTHRENSRALTADQSSPPPDTPGPTPDDEDVEMGTPLAYDRKTVLAMPAAHSDKYPYALADTVDLGTLNASSIPFQINPGIWPVPYMPAAHALENVSKDDFDEITQDIDTVFLCVLFHGGYKPMSANGQTIASRLLLGLSPVIGIGNGSITSIHVPTAVKDPGMDRFAAPFTLVGRTSTKAARDDITRFFTAPFDEDLAVHIINPCMSDLSWNIAHLNCTSVVADEKILLDACRFAAFQLVTKDLAGLELRNIIGAATQGDKSRTPAEHVHDVASSLFAVAVHHDDKPFLMLCGRPFTISPEKWESFCGILRSVLLRNAGHLFVPHGYRADQPDRILPRPICKMCKMDTHKEYMCPFSQSTFAWKGPRSTPPPTQSNPTPNTVLPTGSYTPHQSYRGGGRGGRGSPRGGRGRGGRPYRRGRGY